MSGHGASSQKIQEIQERFANLRTAQPSRTPLRTPLREVVSQSHGRDTIKESRSKSINPKDLDSLFTSVGWEPRGNVKWREIIAKSSAVISMWDGTIMVGFARMVEDGNIATFHDGVVSPGHQKNGLLTRMMARGIEEARSRGIADSNIGLVAAPGTMSMYMKLGWSPATNAMVLGTNENRATTIDNVEAGQPSEESSLSDLPSTAIVDRLSKLTAELVRRQE